jgi:hypothetical protein
VAHNQLSFLIANVAGVYGVADDEVKPNYNYSWAPLCKSYEGIEIEIQARGAITLYPVMWLILVSNLLTCFAVICRDIIFQLCPHIPTVFVRYTVIPEYQIVQYWLVVLNPIVSHFTICIYIYMCVCFPPSIHPSTHPSIHPSMYTSWIPHKGCLKWTIQY